MEEDFNKGERDRGLEKNNSDDPAGAGGIAGSAAGHLLAYA